MKTYVWLTFAFLGWGYYEASGGADFHPEAVDDATTIAEADAQISVDRRTSNQKLSVSRGSIQNRVETALLVALRDAPGAAHSKNLAAGTPVALRAEPETMTFAPVRAVAFDTSGRPASNSESSNTDAATAEAPATSIRPRLRQSSKPDIETPRVSTRGQIVESHEVVVTNANLRMGPGTNFPVLDQLGQGTSVRLLAQGEDGWVKLRAADPVRVGWMAGYLIAER